MRASTQPTVRYAHPRRTRLHDRPVRHRARPRADLRDRLPRRGEPVPGAQRRARSPAGDPPPRPDAVPGGAQPLPLGLLGPAAATSSRGPAIAISILLVIGLPQRAPLPVTMAAWLALWILYQSIVNVGGTFYGFGWESLLLEAGFLAIFLGNAETAPQWLVILAFRWLAFRVEFGAGLIKLRGDDVLAPPAMHGLPPRDAADAEPALVVLPPPAATAPPARGARQLLRPAGPAVGPVPAPAVRLGRGRPDDPHPALPRRQRQLRLAELADDPRLRRRHRGPGGRRRRGHVRPDAGLVRRPRHRAGGPRRRPELVADPEHGQPGPGDERLVQPVPHRQHVRGLRDGGADALRGRRGGSGGRRRPTTAGASTSSRASPATPDDGRRRSRRTTTASTG